MRIFDVLEYTGTNPDELAHRVPDSGMADIRWGSQLVVRESQSAVFFRDGKALDTFGAGRHVLTTGNLPVFVDLVKGIYDGKTVFQSEVFFVNQRVMTDLKWGTPSPIDLKDPDLGWVSIRAYGAYTLRVADPQLFVNTMVGTQGIYFVDKLNEFLKGSILTHLNDLMGEAFKSYAVIRKDFEELASAMKVKVADDFDKYGIELRDFFIQDVSVPEAVQSALQERARMGAIGDMGKYMQMKTADAIGDFAKGSAEGGAGSTAGQAVGVGAGLGMGMIMPGMIQQAVSGGAAGAGAAVIPSIICPSCKQAIPPGSKFCPLCGASMEIASRQTPSAPCPKCGNPVQQGAKFCPDCGEKLS
ncbi:MAG: SPFH domain-containing protein [Chloroflexi bacterium]|nr:SPFH domain-containing protein [Chloroflexota bacterium]